MTCGIPIYEAVIIDVLTVDVDRRVFAVFVDL